MGMIELSQVEKWFNNVQVIKGIDLEIKSGEFVVIVGASGCGKSTLLRMIGGLEETSRGDIFIDSVNVTSQPPSKRGLSMVFQSYALYPHLTVEENMGFPFITNCSKMSELRRPSDSFSILAYLNAYTGISYGSCVYVARVTQLACEITYPLLLICTPRSRAII